MKLHDENSVFNMGDTSIRVKQIVEVNKFILKQLNEFMGQNIIWTKNPTVQESFYNIFIKELNSLESSNGSELFADFNGLNRSLAPKKERLGLRGRTLTNALFKSGLIDSNRNVGKAAKKYLANNLKENDNIEKLLSLSTDNLLYLRQYLKLRIYSHSSDEYFYNFRFAIKFLSLYDNVPQYDFLTIIESIRPSSSEDEIKLIIQNYRDVNIGNKSFKDYYIENFTNLLAPKDNINAVKNMFSKQDFSDENFKNYFPNAKSGKTSLLYKDFVLSIIDFKTQKSLTSLKKMIDISKDQKIKKAFSYGKLPFTFSKNDSIDIFLEKNKESQLLNDDYYNIYKEFLMSKQEDLIGEYSDMCRRCFQTTALISFYNGQVNLTNKEIIKPLLHILGDRFNLVGVDSFAEYENNIDSIWFDDITIMEIFDITQSDYDLLIKELAKKYGVQNISKIPEIIEENKESEFRNFIYTNFPKDKVIQILNNISIRNDEEVAKKVTDSATIPTIYEYILTIAWFYLSKEKDYHIHKSFGVSLDSNNLPLIHQGAGKGDIEILSKRYSLLIEATLMDLNAQKRGELEPVIRHSTNFYIDNSSSNIQTIFVANALDDNVLNIFRATQFIELNGTINSNKKIKGLNIFAFTTDEVVRLLENNIYDNQIINAINKNLDTTPLEIKNNWRDKILSSIF